MIEQGNFWFPHKILRNHSIWPMKFIGESLVSLGSHGDYRTCREEKMDPKGPLINASYSLFPSSSREISYVSLSIITSRLKRVCKASSPATAIHRILLQTISSAIVKAILTIMFSKKAGLWPKSNKSREFTHKLDSCNRLIAGFSTRMWTSFRGLYQ